MQEKGAISLQDYNGFLSKRDLATLYFHVGQFRKSFALLEECRKFKRENQQFFNNNGSISDGLLLDDLFDCVEEIIASFDKWQDDENNEEMNETQRYTELPW